MARRGPERVASPLVVTLIENPPMRGRVREWDNARGSAGVFEEMTLTLRLTQEITLGVLPWLLPALPHSDFDALREPKVALV